VHGRVAAHFRVENRPSGAAGGLREAGWRLGGLGPGACAGPIPPSHIQHEQLRPPCDVDLTVAVGVVVWEHVCG
jgi:hypothetical protein